MAHEHNHEEQESRLALVAGINLLGFLVELAGGLLFGSVALLSDALHMLFDALAYVMAWSAEHLASNYEQGEKWSYGLHRLEPLSAFVNGVLLVPMSLFIMYEAYNRFLNPVTIGVGPTIAVATFGLLLNLASVYVLQGDEMNLNEKGAFYHLLGDAGASVAVIVSSVLVSVTEVTMIDPVTAILIATLILWSAGKLVAGSAGIFLHISPVARSEIDTSVQSVEGVGKILDCHTWEVCSELTIATLQIEVDAGTIDELEEIRENCHSVLSECGVDHATVELLPPGYGDRTAEHSH